MILEQVSRTTFTRGITLPAKNPSMLWKEMVWEAHKINKHRAEFYEMKHLVPDAASYLEKMEANLKTVVMVVDMKNIEDPLDGSDCVLIKSKFLKDRKVSEDNAYAICPDMVYSNQQSAYSIGSGFFIKEKVIATAAHTVVSAYSNFQDIRFVYGVYLEGPDFFKNEIRVHKSKIFKPHTALTAPNAHYLSKMSSDWALVQVEQAYTGFEHPVIAPVVVPDPNLYASAFATSKIMSQAVYGIGHGLGLPVKVSYAGKVSWMAKRKPYFETNLILLGGNSGSPIFSAETHELLGMYIRGTKKFVLSNCDNGMQHLIIKDEATHYEGQECQRLEPILNALRTL